MMLYGTDHSPFVTRVTMAAQALGVTLELVSPPGGASSEAYRKIVPTGLVPALVLPDGNVLCESEVIVEYLADSASDASAVRPADPALRARARLLARIADLYLAEPLRELFEQAKGATPSVDALALTIPRIREALVMLDRTLDTTGPFAAGPRFSTAECALVPLLFFVGRCDALSRRYDGAGMFDSTPRLGRYFVEVRADPIAHATLDAMNTVQVRRAEERARTGTNAVR